MKKAFFVGIIVVLALAMVTCDIFPPAGTGSNKTIEYTEDGRPMVELVIKTGGSGRALTADLAKAGSDFYEVAFYDDTLGSERVYRASWDYTQTGRIRVPLKTYTGAAQAILFAGRQSDKTLFAVGIITAITGGGSVSGAVTTITAATSSVTFTLDPLVTDVHGRKQTGDPSSFVITQAGYETATLYATKELPYAKFIDKTIPIFGIADVASTATLTLSMATGAFATYNPGMNTLPWVAADAIRIAGVSISEESENKPVMPLPTASITAPDLATITTTPTAVPDTIEITFTPDVATTSGLFKFALALPLCAISDKDYPITWYIRGGLQNGLYDEGNAVDSLGGSILLCIGNIADGFTILTN